MFFEAQTYKVGGHKYSGYWFFFMISFESMVIFLNKN